MKLYYISFTDKGEALAHRLSDALGGEVSRCRKPLTADKWTAERFQTGAGLVFVGAAGIAVRSVAPYLRDKTTDPAVVVVDELGRFAAPILSGHMGGANKLAGLIADLTGGQAVITTATDVNGLFSVDCWAKSQGCAIPNKDEIKYAAMKILSGEALKIKSRWEISGTPPDGAEIVQSGGYDVIMDVYGDGQTALHVVPNIVALGIGCKRGIAFDIIYSAYQRFISDTGLHRQSIFCVASIDLKRDEEGIIRLTESLGVPFYTYSADDLRAVRGEFTASEFVRRVTGVDNVCERAAALSAGGGVIERKRSYDGVTFAAAERVYTPDWRM